MRCIAIIRQSLTKAGSRNVWTTTARFVNDSQKSDEKYNSDEKARNNGDNVDNNETNEEYENNIKGKILDESLKYVQQYGWSRDAIIAGAESMNYPGVTHGLFPKGGVDLIHHFNLSCNAKLNEEMEKYVTQCESNVVRKTAETIVEEAIQKRLQMIVPYKQQWPQALALMSLPPNVPLALSNITTLIDNICFYAGDRSVDMNWYMRRIGLAAIYKSTELYMIQDSSEDNRKTWEFLNRRIKEASELNKISSSFIDISQPEQLVQQTGNLVSAIFGTAQNIIGLNWKK